MPTGYTYDVATGELDDFRTFALRCARAFGATLTQRDDPLDVLPERRVPSEYHNLELAKAQQRLQELQSMSLVDAQIEMDIENAEILERNTQNKREREAKRARYQKMIDAVDAWEAPTVDHVELKMFMRQQLTESMDMDRREWPNQPIIPQTAEAWLTEKRFKTTTDIAYHATQYAEEVERCNQANKWIDALYNSLQPSSSDSSLGAQRKS